MGQPRARTWVGGLVLLFACLFLSACSRIPAQRLPGELLLVDPPTSLRETRSIREDGRAPRPTTTLKTADPFKIDSQLAVLLPVLLASEKERSVDLFLEHKDLTADAQPPKSLAVLISGLRSAEEELECRVSNLVHRNSVAYKRWQVRTNEVADSTSSLSKRRNFAQGAFRPTDNPLDVAIVGKGFFILTLPNGESAYTRVGQFSVNENSQLVISVGERSYHCEPPITLPSERTGVLIQPSGEVMIQLAGSAQLQSAGALQLASFPSHHALRLDENGLFVIDENGVVPTVGQPGDGEMGKLKVGCLEASNVDVLDEAMAIARVRRKLHMIRELIRRHHPPKQGAAAAPSDEGLSVRPNSPAVVEPAKASAASDDGSSTE